MNTSMSAKEFRDHQEQWFAQARAKQARAEREAAEAAKEQNVPSWEDYMRVVVLERSNPVTTLIDARRMWIRHFDSRTNIATFSVEDLDVTDSAISEVVVMCSIIKETLSRTVGNRGTHVASLEVAVAGSAEPRSVVEASRPFQEFLSSETTWENLIPND